MSETISEKEKSKSHDASSAESQALTRMTKRLRAVMDLWSEHADNEYEFGVIRGLQLALDVLENR